MKIKYSAEILKIIEAGIEGDIEKVKAYSKLLADKMPEGDHMRRAIITRLDGSYKKGPVLVVKGFEKKEGSNDV